MDERFDRIQLSGLRVTCVIGTRPEERRRRQEIDIDITLHVSLEKAGRSDRLEDTVDYSRLAAEVKAMAEGSSFQLIERLAAEVASLCLARPRVERVQVRVEKPHALPTGRAAAVEILRDRSSIKGPMGFGRVV